MRKRYFILIFIFLGLIPIYQIPAVKKDFTDLYPNNDAAAQSLQTFRNKKIKEIEVNNIKWLYYCGGQGSETILFLHGMGGAYDLWWQQVLYFEPKYRVISYTLPPPISSLKQAAEGIEAILKQEKVTSCNLVGTSMGGYIAQYLVQTMPQHISKAVFGNTFPPNDLIKKENRFTSILVRFLPEAVIAYFAEQNLKKKVLPAASKNQELLAAFLLSLPFSKQS